MAITITEKFATRKNGAKEIERTLFIQGTTDDQAARDAMMQHALCPPTVTQTNWVTAQGTSGPVVTSYATTFYRSDEDCEVEELCDGMWVGTALWKSLTFTAGSFSFSFDISGQQQKVLQSRQTINSYVSGSNPKRNFRGAIGVNEDGTVEGVDVLIPYLTYQETRTYSAAQVTTAFINTMSTLVGSVNLNAYAGYQPGEILLTKCSGQTKGDGTWDITFGWSVSRNQTSLTVNDMTGIVKDGWDYLWVYYHTMHDTTTNCTHKVPISCYVERLYVRNDFSGLAIS